MLRCKDVSRLIAADEHRRAGLVTRLAVHTHLFMCSRCRRFAAELREIRQALTALPRDSASDANEAEAVERIVRRLKMRHTE